MLGHGPGHGGGIDCWWAGSGRWWHPEQGELVGGPSTEGVNRKPRLQVSEELLVKGIILGPSGDKVVARVPLLVGRCEGSPLRLHAAERRGRAGLAQCWESDRCRGQGEEVPV